VLPRKYQVQCTAVNLDLNLVMFTAVVPQQYRYPGTCTCRAGFYSLLPLGRDSKFSTCTGTSTTKFSTTGSVSRTRAARRGVHKQFLGFYIEKYDAVTFYKYKVPCSDPSTVRLPVVHISR
jgi:hypothetical protein